MSTLGDGLKESLGYTFQAPELLKQALTHRSLAGENNERLEFLGDSIVNWITADDLYRRHPEATEGELTRLRSKLINGETLAQIARGLDLGEHLLLGGGENKTGGRQRASILADALEAVIAAIFLDGGIAVCKTCVLQWYETHLPERSTLASELKDPKSQLQEYVQSQKLSLPEYKTLEIKGEDHTQLFTVHCQVNGLDHIGEGKGTSRRKAEQAAAVSFLEKINHYSP